jgi:hypothetical protein
MPHAAINLIPGVNTQETAAMNQGGGVSESQLIRYYYDQKGAALIGKLGGWTKFYPTPMVAIPRALWAWEDLNDTSHLAVGTETVTATGSAQLAVITNGTLQDITPTQTIISTQATVAVTAGSSLVTINDPLTTGITDYDSVYITTQIAIGGIILFGLYQCDPNGKIFPEAFEINAVDILGNPNPATSSSSMPVLPIFSVSTDSTTVKVTLPNYTYSVGDTFPVLVPTTVGGITFYGNYIVDSITDVNNFSIIAQNEASSTTTGTLNGGVIQFIYSFATGALPGTGYGIGGYGLGAYGVGQLVIPTTGTNVPAIDWTLDNFGDVLIACAVQNPAQPAFQPIYAWNPGTASAAIIPQAPPVNDGVFVAMPQRQLVAWGSTQTGIQDPLLINWCDVGNYNQWIALVTNQAGSYRIPKGSRIVSCVQGPQQAVVWTDIDCWSMQYIGTPYVYSFNEIGTGCGLIARKAAAAVNGIYYWMGPQQFYTLSSEGVQPLPCAVWDAVYQNLNTANVSKIRVAVNSRFGEISWYYPSANGTGEVDSYVKYNVYLSVWDVGTLGRSAWVDQSVLGPPVGSDPVSLYLYQHETSNDADGTAMLPSFQTGYYAIGEADVKSFVDWVFPDMKWGMYDAAQSASVQISFYVADYPSQAPTLYGPYSVTQATLYFYTRLRGKLISVKVSSSDLGSYWRIGQIRYRYAIDGQI